MHLSHRILIALAAAACGPLSLVGCTVGDGGGTGTQQSDWHYCHPQLIDEDGDGYADGVDYNCDGAIDYYFDQTGGDGTTSNTSSCSTQVSINGVSEGIKCTSSGGPYTCECSTNGTVVSTCTTSSTSACSIDGTTSNCCGF